MLTQKTISFDAMLFDGTRKCAENIADKMELELEYVNIGKGDDEGQARFISPITDMRMYIAPSGWLIKTRQNTLSCLYNDDFQRLMRIVE